MAKTYTSIGITHRTKGRFELAKEEYYGEDLCEEVSQDKFLDDLCKDALNEEL